MSHSWLPVLPSGPFAATPEDSELGWPARGGAPGIRPLQQRFPGLLMLVVTVPTDDPRTAEAICAVACEYLLQKTIDTGVVIHSSPEVHPPERTGNRLTPHEVRLLKLLMDGHSYKSAAAALGVSRHTVSFHLRSVYEKMEVHSKSEAVGKAFRDRLV
jgi:DNA-binding NarL/FixJ family response regulator